MDILSHRQEKLYHLHLFDLLIAFVWLPELITCREKNSSGLTTGILMQTQLALKLS